MNGALTLWTVIIGAGLLTYLSRLSFIALFARREMPSLTMRALRYVPAAMLTAIVVAAIGIPGVSVRTDTLYHAKLIAALLAAIVAWRTRSPALTIAAGMVALWAAQWLLARLG